MKKFLTYLLLFVILLTPTTLVGCKSKETRKAANFYNEYLDISTQSPRLKEEKLDNRFASNETLYLIKFNFSQDLQAKIEQTGTSYNKIVTFYDELLENVSAPIVMYGQYLTSSNTTQKENETIYSKLDSLTSAYLDTSSKLGDLEKTLGTESLANINLSNLLYSYETLIFRASNLSNKISSIYFNSIATANPNYIAIEDDKINLQSIGANALNRRVYYLSVFADIYLNVYILGNQIPSKIINGESIAQYTPYKILNNARYSNNYLDNLDSNRDSLIKYARSFYLLQNDFEIQYQNYHTAIEKMTYSLVDSSSSVESQGYKKIVDQFVGNGGIAYSAYETLTRILSLSFSTY